MSWRVGRKLGRTLYRDGECIGMVDSPELAAEIVAAMNGRDAVIKQLAKSLRDEANRAERWAKEGTETNGNLYTRYGFRMAADFIGVRR